MSAETDYIYAQSEAAARYELDQTDWPPDDADAERMGKTVGGVAAAAACTAYGLGAAAPLCASIGSSIGGYLAGVLSGLFGGGEPAQGGGAGGDAIWLARSRFLWAALHPGQESFAASDGGPCQAFVDCVDRVYLAVYGNNLQWGGLPRAQAGAMIRDYEARATAELAAREASKQRGLIQLGAALRRTLGASIEIDPKLLAQF